jgi:transcriptional regulator with XRE-family HTH domain
MGKNKKSTPDEWIVLVSQRIKELRKEKGYTSYETFALDNGLDRKQYWRVENGSNITLRTLIKILEIHRINPSNFFKSLED